MPYTLWFVKMRKKAALEKFFDVCFFLWCLTKTYMKQTGGTLFILRVATTKGTKAPFRLISCGVYLARSLLWNSISPFAQSLPKTALYYFLCKVFSFNCVVHLYESSGRHRYSLQLECPVGILASPIHDVPPCFLPWYTSNRQTQLQNCETTWIPELITYSQTLILTCLPISWKYYVLLLLLPFYPLVTQ